MRTILVPIDFSFITESTVEAASALARMTNSSLAFLHVVQENMYFDGMGIPVPSLQDDSDAMVLEAQRALNRYAAAAASSGITATASVLRGQPAKLILAKAAELKPEFIVMGSHGYGSIHRLLAGSTAQGVLKGAECPILLLPAKCAERSETLLPKTEATVSP